MFLTATTLCNLVNPSCGQSAAYKNMKNIFKYYLFQVCVTPQGLILI